MKFGATRDYPTVRATTRKPERTARKIPQDAEICAGTTADRGGDSLARIHDEARRYDEATARRGLARRGDRTTRRPHDEATARRGDREEKSSDDDLEEERAEDEEGRDTVRHLEELWDELLDSEEHRIPAMREHMYI